MNKLDTKSKNITQENIDKIIDMFPIVATEGVDEEGNTCRRIDFETLRQVLGGGIVEKGEEGYQFTWVGKNAAIAEAYRRTNQTLRPVKKESKNWNTTQNIYIEGDNLAVLKLLQKNPAYVGKIKMIYIDPPYNTGNDFVYNDDFRMSQEEADEAEGALDDDGKKQFDVNNKADSRYHSKWCSMIYSRLIIAKYLLTEDGAIFISIDENEYTNLKKLCDSVFGESNKVAEFVIIRAEGGGMAKQVIKGHDYLLVYANKIDQFIPLGKSKDIRGKIIENQNGRYWIQEDWLRKEFGKYGNCHYEEILKYKGQDTLDEINTGLETGKYMLIPKSNGMNIVGKLRNLQEDSSKFYSILKHLSAQGVKDLQSIGMGGFFSYPKPVSLIHDIIMGMTLFVAKEEVIILDFFSGSATTAHAVMQLNAEDGGNRKFILVNLPEECPADSEAAKAGFKNICEIGKERIRRAGEKIKAEHPDAKDLDIGFRVFRLDSTNMEDVFVSPKDLDQTKLQKYIQSVKRDRSVLDLLYGVVLKSGLSLSMKHTKETIRDTDVYFYGNGMLAACFAPGLDTPTIKEIAARKPLKAVFRESCFAKPKDRVNLGELFKLISPDTVVEVL